MIATSIYTFGEGPFSQFSSLFPAPSFTFVDCFSSFLFPRSVIRCVGPESVWSSIGQSAFGIYHRYLCSWNNNRLYVYFETGYSHCTRADTSPCLLSDVNIIGATLAPLINSISPSFCLEEKWIQIIVAGGILLPLSSLKSMAMFRFTGFAAFLCIMFVMISIIIGGARTIITEGANLTNNIVWADFSFNSIFNALPVVAFAYVFHASFFPIWDSMEDGSNKKITAATSLALGFVAIVYMAIGSFGYLSFGSHTDSNIMENYPASDILMVVAKVGYLLVVCAAYPINCFVLRSSLDKLIFSSSQPAPWWRNILIALVLVSLSTVLAIVLPTISLILGIVGSVPGSFLAFIFPALFYIILVDNNRSKNVRLLHTPAAV